MGLRARLARLEACAPGGADTVARDAAVFVDRIAALCARIEAGDDLADRPGAASAERYCRALLRGDGEMADGIIATVTKARA